MFLPGLPSPLFIECPVAGAGGPVTIINAYTGIWGRATVPGTNYNKVLQGRGLQGLGGSLPPRLFASGRQVQGPTQKRYGSVSAARRSRERQGRVSHVYLNLTRASEKGNFRTFAFWKNSSLKAPLKIHPRFIETDNHGFTTTTPLTQRPYQDPEAARLSAQTPQPRPSPGLACACAPRSCARSP